MTPEDAARVVVYSAVILPATVFVLTYTLCFPFIRRSTEAWHLLLFTASIDWIAIEILLSHLGVLDFSLMRFLIAVSVSAVLVCHRVYLLYKNLVIPLLRRRLARRRASAGAS